MRPGTSIVSNGNERWSPDVDIQVLPTVERSSTHTVVMKRQGVVDVANETQGRLIVLLSCRARLWPLPQVLSAQECGETEDCWWGAGTAMHEPIDTEVHTLIDQIAGLVFLAL